MFDNHTAEPSAERSEPGPSFGEGKYYTLQYETGRPGTAVVEITNNETLKLVERHGGAIIIMTSDCYNSNLCHDVLSIHNINKVKQ
jgi:hypothetical protein